MRSRVVTLTLAVLAVSLLTASAGAELRVECPDSVAAGETFIVDIETNENIESMTLRWLGREMRPEYWWEPEGITASVRLGMGLVDRLDGERHTLQVEIATTAGPLLIEREIHRVAKEYPEQRLEVSSKYTELSAEDLARTERESAMVKKALATVSAPGKAHIPFLRPVPGQPTSVFGLRRFFNEVPKRSHSGLDLRAAEGDPVHACADGRVILVGEHFYAGGSVYIDHGQGIISMYFHLSAIDVEDGQEIRRGELVGKAGETGRVTGAHLHWGVSVLGQLVDPRLLL